MRSLLVVLISTLAALAADPPDQAKRGKELFNLKSSAGYACTTCHELAGEGTAIGPDLRIMGRLHPRAFVMGLLATRTQYVKEVTSMGGHSFPAVQSGESFFDLSKNPPVKVEIKPADFQAAKDNAAWKHPPETRGLKKAEIADLIAYIRFASIGDTKGVDEKDIP